MNEISRGVSMLKGFDLGATKFAKYLTDLKEKTK